jgi:Acetyltransferase (GNAT) domain
VVPEAARRGVGTALVKEIKRIPTTNGVQALESLASVNAEPFYASLGYESDLRRATCGCTPGKWTRPSRRFVQGLDPFFISRDDSAV